MAIPTSPHQQVGVPRPGRVGAEALSDASCLRLPNPANQFPTPESRARAAEMVPASGQSRINPRGFSSKKETRKENSRTKKSTRDFAKGGNRGSPPRPPTRGKRGARDGTQTHLVSPPPLPVFAIATTPRLGTIRLRARASALHRGAQADRAGVLVGSRGGTSYALRRLDPVKAAAAGFPDATATGGGREVRLDFSLFFLACPGFPVPVAGEPEGGKGESSGVRILLGTVAYSLNFDYHVAHVWRAAFLIRHIVLAT